MKKTVLLGVTSGIAAYKSLDLIKLLKAKKIDVQVMMTPTAHQMVSPKEFEKISGHAVFTDLFENNFDYKKVLETRKVDHIQLADRADVLVIAPATANCIGKLANGIADDFLTTTVLAVTAPVILCPSMNVNMWRNPLVQANLEKLKKLGYQIIEPTVGALACGYEGKGRLADVEHITQETIKQLYRTNSLSGKKIIITAGGTVEPIDDVRFITNKSSGKMGAALAEECYLRGADVLLLRAKTAVGPRYCINELIFETADDLSTLLKTYVPKSDIIFHTAAISDFHVDKQLGKISSESQQILTLHPRQKIVDLIKQWKPNITLIAFKAEHDLTEEELIEKAKQKLKQTQADAVIANDVSKTDRGFQSDTNEVIIVLSNGKQKKIPLQSKRAVASAIIEFTL